VLRSRTLLLDTDFFVLMAGANLITPVLEALGCDLGRTRRLAPLPYMLKKGRLARRYPEGVRDKASAWCERIEPVEARPSTDFLEPLLEVVDEGEALLLATVAGLSDGIVATGDKRACGAIAMAPTLSEIRPRLAGKVLCLEVVLELLLNRLGFQKVATALIPVRDYSTTLRLLLPEAGATSEEHFRAGLASHVRSLRHDAGVLLFQPT